MNPVNIFGKPVGIDSPCLIIAEAGVNFNGSLELAKELVDVALQAGADVVKFQTFKSENVVTHSAPKANYALETTDAAESHLDMMRSLELKPEMHQPLMAHCDDKGIRFLSSPFDEQSADLLESVGVAAFKIPSGEITNLSFLSHVASKGKPMIVSTGMSTLGEVDEAIRVIQHEGNDQIVLLHCVSNYPASPDTVNLRAMRTMALAFGLPVGFSDHTKGLEISLAAVALGARVIEKHFTLDRSMVGPDHQASLEPRELNDLVSGIRAIESALGDGMKVPSDSEHNTATVARKSLVASRALQEGHILRFTDIAIKRPGIGMKPSELKWLEGRTLNKSTEKDELFHPDMFV